MEVKNQLQLLSNLYKPERGTFRFSWLWSCVVGLLIPYISKDHSSTILGVKQFKTIYLGPPDPLRWRHSDPSFEPSDHQSKPIHTLSHPRHLNCHNSTVRTSSFMYVSVFLISLWHFIIYDLVVGNTAQLGMLLPYGRWVMCCFILMFWLVFGGGSYCPQAVCPPSAARQRSGRDDVGPGVPSLFGSAGWHVVHCQYCILQGG